MCLPLTNVTLVVPSADEVSYLTFMSTMYNSPSPSLRELAGFYYTDLKMTAFDVSIGWVLRCACRDACRLSQSA